MWVQKQVLIGGSKRLLREEEEGGAFSQKQVHPQDSCFSLGFSTIPLFNTFCKTFSCKRAYEFYLPAQLPAIFLLENKRRASTYRTCSLLVHWATQFPLMDFFNDCKQAFVYKPIGPSYWRVWERLAGFQWLGFLLVPQSRKSHIWVSLFR